MVNPERFDTLDAHIGATLEDTATLLVAADHFRTLEEEVIVDMVASIAGGWRTEQEAFNVYMAWKARYQVVGKIALE